MDVFKSNENKQLKERIAQLEAMMTPEQREIEYLTAQIAGLRQTMQENLQHISQLQAQSTQLSEEIERKREASIECVGK